MPKFLDPPQWYNSSGGLIEHLYLVRVEMSYDTWAVGCPMVLPINVFSNTTQGAMSDYQVFLIMLNSFSPSSNGRFNFFAGGYYDLNSTVVGIYMTLTQMQIIGASNSGTTVLATIPQATLQYIRVTFYSGATQII